MKKLLFGLLLISQFTQAVTVGFHSGCETCECKTTSNTFFNIEAPFRWISPERLTNFHDRFDSHGDDYYNGAIQVVPLGGASMKNERIAQFFLPACTQSLIVAEQQSEHPDVLANQLNIYTQEGNFLSKVTFKPQHHFAGAGLTYQQSLYRRDNGNLLWIAFSGPILHVRNQIKICERIQQDGGGPLTLEDRSTRSCESSCSSNCLESCGENACCPINNLEPLPAVASVKQAFAQPGWCYGKITECTHTKTGFADLNVVAGYQVINTIDYYLDSFFGAIFPTGNKPHAKLVFEPMIGHNNHYGILLGNSCGMRIYDSECYDFHARFTMDFDIEYFFARNEWRSFDLKHKPWSRYMQFYGSKEQAQTAADNQVADPLLALTLGTPGINILTQNVEVKPGFSRSFNIAWIIDLYDFDLEGGYNFFARQAECIKLNCRLPEEVALKSLQGSGKTTVVGQINNNYDQCLATPLDAYDTSIITHHDIDLNSAAHPGVLSHQIYGSAAYNWCINETQVFAALGGSYELSPNNSGITRWMAWGKMGLTF